MKKNIGIGLTICAVYFILNAIALYLNIQKFSILNGMLGEFNKDTYDAILPFTSKINTIGQVILTFTGGIAILFFFIRKQIKGKYMVMMISICFASMYIIDVGFAQFYEVSIGNATEVILGIPTFILYLIVLNIFTRKQSVKI